MDWRGRDLLFLWKSSVLPPKNHPLPIFGVEKMIFWGVYLGGGVNFLPPEDVEESSQEDEDNEDTSDGAADNGSGCHGLSACRDNLEGKFGVNHALPGHPPSQNSAPTLVLTLGQGLKLMLGAVCAVAVLGECLDPHHIGSGRGQLGEGDGGALAAQH